MPTKHIIALIVGLWLVPAGLIAQWPLSPDSSIHVGYVGSGYAAIEDGLGGAYVAYGYQDLRRARIDNNGRILWSDLHLDYSHDEAVLNGYSVSTDSCILLVYHDLDWISTELAEATIIAQKVDVNGNKLWGEGIIISPPDVSGDVPGGHFLQSKIVASAEGGAYVAWSDLRRGGYTRELYVQRLTAEGAMIWQEDGVLVADSLEQIKYLSPLTDSTVAVVYNTADLAWNRHHLIQTFSDSGLPLFDSIGVLLPTIPGIYYSLDTLGFLFFRHEGDRVMKLNTNVLPVLETHDYHLETPGTTFIKALRPDNLGGVFLSINSDGPTIDQAYNQWIDADGDYRLGPNGVLAWSAQFFFNACIIPSDGGMICVNAGEGHDAYRIDSTGIFAWDSVRISNTTSAFYPWPKAIPDGFGGAIYFFNSEYSLFVTKVNSDGSMGVTSSINIEPPLPRFSMLDVYPNPFNPSITIEYSLDQPTKTTLKVYNLLGQTVHHQSLGWLEPSMHHIEWNARDLSSGVYIVEVRSGMQSARQKVVLLR